MKDRMSRSHKSRKDFKVDQMLTTAEQKYRTDFQKCKDLYEYMSLMFIGVYNKYLFDQQTVKTDVYISNAPQRKRMFKVGTKPDQVNGLYLFCIKICKFSFFFVRAPNNIDRQQIKL